MKAKGVMLVLGCSLLLGLVINRSLAHRKKVKIVARRRRVRW